MLVAILICFFAPLPPPPSSTLFPYTTLFRSQQRIDQQTDLNISITVTTAEGETISAGDDPRPGATEARTQGSGSEGITVVIPQSDVRAHTAGAGENGRAHASTPVTWPSRMPASASTHKHGS